jgi:hypothetical protein
MSADEAGYHPSEDPFAECLPVPLVKLTGTRLLREGAAYAKFRMVASFQLSGDKNARKSVTISIAIRKP